jgi:hypothetical protein
MGNWPLGYNEFDFFLENKEYRPSDGFFARLASKFEKSTNMAKKNFVFKTN